MLSYNCSKGTSKNRYCRPVAAGRSIKMNMDTYITYDGKVRVDVPLLVVYLWNKYTEDENPGKKIFTNNKEFFEDAFDNSYDADMAVSLSGRWRWTDSFVYFDEEGYLTSFSRLDDENSPIDMDKIDIDYLIRALQDLQRSPKKWHKKGCVNNIPRAIHDALQE